MDHHTPLTAGAARLRVPTVVLVAVFALVALAGALFPSFSTGATLLVAGVGAVLFWLGSAERLPRRPATRRLPVGAAWWAVPALLLGVVELIDFRLGSTYAIQPCPGWPTRCWPAHLPRALAWFGWQWAFLGLARR